MKNADKVTTYPNILLLGNGINRCFDNDSWQKVIENIIKESKTNINFNDICGIPATMQIVLASNDHVDKYMKEFASKLLNNRLEDKQKEILCDLLDMNFDSILTTNYSYELELASNIKQSLNSFYSCRNWTKKDLTKKEKKMHLYEYNNVKNNKIWHIHGDICTSSSIVIGHYYYGKLLSEIEKYCSTLIARHKNTNYEYKYNSWVDYFVTSNIYILGFSLDLSETDLWWLLCYKHRHFNDTNAYFYQPDKDLTYDKRLMLETYGVTVKDNIQLKDNDYFDYYNCAIKDIKRYLNV